MKMKKLLSLFLTIFTMFFMVEGVSAADPISFEGSGLKTTIGSSIIRKGNLGYYVSDGYDDTALGREEELYVGSSKFTYDNSHGSINVFGYDEDTVYETSRIIGSSKLLSGIFPVVYIGNGNDLKESESQISNYKFFKKSSDGILEWIDTASGLKATVTPSHVLNDQFIKLSFVVSNTSSSDKIISMAAYNDITLDGIDNATPTSEDKIVATSKGFSITAQNSTTKKIRKLYIITEDFLHVTNAQYWIGNRDTSNNSNEYSKAFKSSSKSFDSTVSVRDTAMAFSWNNITVPANDSVTKSIIIGLGDLKPSVEVEGETEYNLDNNDSVNVNINYMVPTDGNAYKLYYKLNDGEVKTIDDADLTKAVAATKVLDLINDEDLNKCGDNILTAWIGPSTNSDFAKAVDSDQHKFTVTAASCVPEKQEESPQTGVNTNYLILGLILIGGIGVYVYGKKHNKFPQV